LSTQKCKCGEYYQRNENKSYKKVRSKDAKEITTFSKEASVERNFKIKFNNQGEIMTAEKVATKPDIVEIVRFYRPILRSEYGIGRDIISDRGVTVMFTLDYAKEIFTARYSVCKGDNFSRATGIAYAQACEHPVYGKLVRNTPLYDMLVDAAANMRNFGDEARFKKVRRNLIRLCDELSKCR
jgi:hypothetical protein